MRHRLRFGRCEVRPQERTLLVDDRVVPLGARAFDVLLVLLAHRDRVVTKAELLDRAWPGLMVEENNLTVQISTLRKALGARAIATVPLVGYQFAAEVQVLAEVPAEPNGWAAPACAMGVVGPPALRDRVLAAVRSHGGQLQPVADPRAWLATFDQVQAAVGAAHQLHRLAGQDGLRAGIAILPAADAAMALGQAARVAAGETWAAADIASGLILPLDGDIEELRAHDGARTEATTRIFRVSAPSNDGPAALAPARSDLRPTVAVVPFRPYALGGPGLHLGDVVVDQVIAALSRSHAIHVISRLSTQPFRDRDSSVQQIVGSLAADFVVSGRFLVSSGRLQVQVELADGRGSHVLWSESIADSEEAALQPDSHLVQALVGGITQTVLAHELRRLRSLPLPDLASHTLLLAGINLLFRLSPGEFDLARSALQTVHERAPRHAEPLAWLARWHLFRVVQGWTQDREADGRQALDLAHRALDLDPDSSLALTMLGNVHTSFLRDLDRADTLYAQALAVNPNESLAWLQKGNACSFRGDGEAALEHVDRAVALSPLDPARHYYLSLQASAALTAGAYERAVDAAQRSLRLNREHVSTHRVLAIALALQDRLDEARSSVSEVLRLEPQLTVQRFIARSPGAQSGLAEKFGRALGRAGLPEDDGTLIDSTGAQR